MAGQIDRNFIDTILARTDIVELINSRIGLQKKGNNYLACCPFHGEKTPSFNVSASKQFYHCFGCGVSGDAIAFLREYEHLEFIDAIEELAERVGLEVPKFVADKHHKNTYNKLSLYQLMESASQFYSQKRQQLQQQQNSVLSQYIHQRGLSDEIINTFNIGYSPDSWDSIFTLLNQHNASQQDKLDTGLIIHNEDKNKLYDRFRDRLMFPIRDRRGKTIGFGGRILSNAKDQAKYINSPETPLFHKGDELYGLYELNQAIRHIEKIVVVEGYMDVVSLAQFGVNYAVATLGTATSSQHIEKLFRATKEIIFCFDGDRAGKDAAWKAMSTILPIIKPDKNIKFMFLAEGEDPDSIVRVHKKEGFEQLLTEAKTLSEFLFSGLQDKVDFNHADGRSQLIDVAKPYLQKIPTDSSFYVLMKDKLAKLTGINLSEISTLIDNASNSESTKNKSLANQNQSANSNYSPSTLNRRRNKQQLTPVWKAISYLLNYPELAQYVEHPDNFSPIDEDGINIFILLLDLLQYDPTFSSARLISLWQNETEKEQLNNILLLPLLIDDIAAITQEFKEILTFLLQQKRKQRFEHLQFIQNNKGLTEKETREYLDLLN